MTKREWPAGWSAIDSDAKRAWLEDELKREMPPGHVLFEASLAVLARRESQDDYVFALPDGRLATVHLTWAVETRPAWPRTTIHTDFDGWLEALEDDEAEDP